MEQTLAAQLAEQLLEQHGLKATGWRQTWMRSARAFGRCCYSSKEVRLSRSLVELNQEHEVRNTILHEIAHALAGPGTGHGSIWKATCIRIGAEPVRCFSADRVVTPKRAWTASCPMCSWSYSATRPRKHASSCPKCSPRRFNPAYRLVWTRNEELPPVGPTSAANTDIAKVIVLREQGMGWAAIEKALGWPDTHGNRPWRLAKAYRLARNLIS